MIARDMFEVATVDSIASDGSAIVLALGRPGQPMRSQQLDVDIAAGDDVIICTYPDPGLCTILGHSPWRPA